MKTKFIIVAAFLMTPIFAQAQMGWRRDSLQFKVFTRLYVNKQLMVDSVKVQKIDCDYCTQEQILGLSEEALHRMRLEINNPKFRKKGVHQTAHYIRVSKKAFKKIKNTDEKTGGR